MTATPDRDDGESLRVSEHGFHVGYARSVRELEQWVDLAALEEELRRSARGNLPVAAALAAGPSAPAPPGTISSDARIRPTGGHL